MFTAPQSILARAAFAIACVAVVAGGAAAQSHYEGAIGPGSSYEIDVPATWNGDLVIYAHGIVQASLPVVLPSQQDGYAPSAPPCSAAATPSPPRATRATAGRSPTPSGARIS